MNEQLRKIIYWGTLLSVYVLMVVVVMRLLVAPEFDSVEVAARQNSDQSLINKFGSSEAFTGVLLPLGPEDGRLPGNLSVWRDFRQNHSHDKASMDTDGFDAVQAVANVSELTDGSVFQLFLSDDPFQVFRRGATLYLLNSQKKVQVLDCSNPEQPRLADSLPYEGVVSMAMQGTVACLLQQRPGAPTGKILVVDLQFPDMPRELARVEVSDKAASLFFINSQLVVYSTKRGMAGHQEVALYDVVENHRLRLYDRGESPNLGQHFLQYEDYLLVAGSGGGLEVYDFSHPLKPERVAFLKTTVLNRLAGSGSMVFATGLGGRLYSFDFRNPLQPVVSTVVDKVDQPAYFLEYDNYSYFFTSNCYLNVFDFSPANSELPEQSSLMVQGELVSLADAGFTLLGQPPASLPSPVTGVLPWPESSKVVDHLVWQDSLVVLDEKGLLSFYRQAEDSSLVFLYTLPLASPQRWLAAFGDYLYAGGQGHITLLAANDDELVSVSGQVDLPGKETWDGLVLKETLYVAAGKDGLLAYSLRRPGTPVATSGWIAPRYLRSEVDVRHLAAADDGRILFTAGPAGFFSGRMQAGREFRLEGSFRFTTPTLAIAAHDGLALVSTGRDVSVVDIRDSHSFQNLGKIAFPGVKKFALDSSDQFAGYSTATGWSFLPLPHFLSNGEENRLNKSLPPHTDRGIYRLHVFNDRDVKIASGLFYAPDGLINQPDAGGDRVR